MTSVHIGLMLNTIIFFVFQFMLFEYSSAILEGKNNKFLHSIMAIINIIISIFVCTYTVNALVLNAVSIITLCINFKLISNKSTFSQIFVNAILFIFFSNIIYMLTIGICMGIYDKSAKELFNLTTVKVFSATFVFSLMTVLAHFSNKIMPLATIKKLLALKSYTTMLAAIIFFMLLGAITDINLMLRSDYEKNQNLYLIITSVFLIILFYFTVLYFLNIVSMLEYKEHSKKMMSAVTDIKEKKADISSKITRDILTGLYNKEYIYAKLESLCNDEHSEFCVLFVDINALKYVNDNFGHEAGDDYIKEVSDSIKKALRQNDFPSRIGGDEFIIIINNVTEKILKTVLSRIDLEISSKSKKVKHPFSISTGWVFSSSELKRQGFLEMLELADINMRENKKKFYKEGV